MGNTNDEFLGLDYPSTYNAILSRLHIFRLAPLAYHMSIKFPTKGGIEIINGDQTKAQKNYPMTMKQMTKSHLIMHINLDLKKEDLKDQKAKLIEDKRKFRFAPMA